jgi:hypothetical protein
VTPIVTSGRSWWQSWWFITGLSVVLIVGAAALIASTTGGDDESSANGDVTARTEPPDDPPAPGAPTTEPPDDDTPITPPPNTDESIDPTPTDPTPTDPAPTEPTPTDALAAGAPAGRRGDRGSPVPPGELADIGEGWRLQVLNVIEDGTELVLAENQFNDPPRDGTKFTLVEVALGYYGLDDPGNAFIPSISGVAAASVELDEDCGVIPDDFRTSTELFSGGVTSGTICYVTTPADDGTVQLYATTGFDGPDVFLAASTPTTPAPMPTLRGPQPGAASTPDRLDPIEVGTPVDVGEGWTLTVTSPAIDITDAVAAENQFNDPPPDGFRFVAVDVEYGYDGAAAAASPFEVSTRMVGDGNAALTKGCGVIPEPVDTFADVFAGGAASGSICWVTPVEDVDTVVLFASTSFDGETFYFATDGPGSTAG